LTESGINSAYFKGRDFMNKNYGLLADVNEEDINKIKSEVKAFCSKKRRNIVTLFMRLKGMFPNLKVFKDVSLDEASLRKFLQENFNTEFPNDLMFNLLENLKCRSRIEKTLKETNKLEKIQEFVSRLVDSHRDVFYLYFESLPKDMHLYVKVFYVADYIERYMENQVEIGENEFKLKELLSDYYKLIVDTTASEPSLFRLFTSKIYSEIFREFEAKVNKNNTNKLVLFSAHDVTMSAFIHSIQANVKNFDFDFNDEINFVLYEIEEEYYISIKYNNQEIPLKICGGEKICEYEHFRNFLIDSISKDEDLENFCEGKLDLLTNADKEVEIRDGHDL
jgi:hypothetical protein